MKVIMISKEIQNPAQDQTSKAWLLPYIITLLAALTAQMSIVGYAPLTPQIVQEFKFSYTQLGLFTGGNGLMGILLSVPAGMAVHRFTEKRVLFLGLVVSCIGITLLSRAIGVITAFGSMIVWYAGYRFVFVGLLAALTFTCPPAWRGRSFGILGAMSSMGVIIGAPFGGYVGRALGWRAAMIGFACVACVAAICFQLLYHRTVDQPSTPAQGEAKAADKRAQKSPFRQPRAWGLACVVGTLGLPSFAITYFAPSAAKMLFHLDGVSIGLMLSAGFVCAVIVNLIGGYLMDRFDKILVLFFVEVLMIPAALTMNLHSLLAFCVSAALIIALSFTASNLGYGLCGELRGSQTANVLGMTSLVAGCSLYLGPQVLGVLRDVSGSFKAGWYFIAFITTATAIGALLLRRVRWDVAGTPTVEASQ
jgi:predicted MFS family arabinose efflux permease